jgi:glycosyltransferase involved in cell wall biosynthesis
MEIVSIITPSFNRADIIEETAQSIFNQTYPYWEWVIVDDGSTDDSWEALEKYAANDARVKIFKRSRNPKGAAACRNIAIENSTGTYLIFLDTDDVIASFCLEQRVKAAQERPESDFIVFPMLLFKSQPDDTLLLWNIDREEDEITRLLFGDPLCQGTGTIWKKKSFVDVGMWNEQLLLWQDIELHLRAILSGLKFTKRLDLKPDVFIRISDVSLSRTGYHSLAKLQSRIKVFTKTADTIHRLHKIYEYKNGLRYMGSDIITSAINSNFYNEARDLIGFCVSKEVLNKSEANTFIRYMQNRRYKLYKLPFISYRNDEKVKSLITKPEGTLGTVKYSKPIIF